MPKLSFDKLKLKLPKLGGSKPADEAPVGEGGDSRKKTVMAAISIVAVAVVGWFAWDAFMVEPPPPPPVAAKSPAVKTPAAPSAEKPAEPAAAAKAEPGQGDTAKSGVAKVEAAKPEAKPAAEPAAAAVVAAPIAVAVAPEAGSRALTARSRLDARDCLKHDSNQAIHRCAEGYR